AADDKTGVNQRYTFREPYPLSRKLGDVGYALEYAEQVVEIKKGEYAAAEDEALSRWYAERANAAMAGVKKGKFTTGARYDELRQQAYNDQIAKDMAVRQGQQ
ncbi:MAG TPA: hypothetical protein VLH38_01815, partial [Patescibacteria group bacterium]|nr:hypothetical protein [Patescibacteria group bacterium]